MKILRTSDYISNRVNKIQDVDKEELEKSLNDSVDIHRIKRAIQTYNIGRAKRNTLGGLGTFKTIPKTKEQKLADLHNRLRDERKLVDKLIKKL